MKRIYNNNSLNTLRFQNETLLEQKPLLPIDCPDRRRVILFMVITSMESWAEIFCVEPYGQDNTPGWDM